MDSRLTRRQIIIRGGELAGAASMLGALGACGSGGGGSTSSAGSAAPVAGKRGGTIRFSQAGVPPGYDLQKWWNAQAGIGTTSIAEPLISVDHWSGERTPRLATEEPTESDGGRTYTFKLRPDVKFHDGNGTMTADDVKFSWERLMDPDFAAEAAFVYTGVPIAGLQAYLAGDAKEIKGLKAVDDLTFEVTLDRPDSAFLPAFTYAHAAVLPRAYYEGKSLKDVNWAPIGTGPFVLESVDKAKGARLARNPDYWDPKVPFVDAVDIEFNVEPQLALLRVQKGELDLMLEPIPAASLNQIRNDPKLKDSFYEGAQNDCQWLSIPTHVKPFDDVRVRKAVAMAIDKEKLAKVVKGLGEPAAGTFFSPESRYAEDGVAWPYDPEQAKQLLAEAGHPDGFEAPFWFQNQPPYSDMGPAVQEDLAKIGIRASGEAKVYDQFIQLTNPGPPAMILFAWEDAYGHGSYVADSAFTSGAIEGGCCNYPKFSSDQLDKLAKAGHDPDQAASDDAYKEIARIVVRDEVLWVPLLYPRRADLANKSVQGFKVAVYPSGQTKAFRYYSLA